MNAEKAAYWLTLAAFGFALQGVCPRGALQSLDHALGHTGSALCRLATNAEQAVMASALMGKVEPRVNDSWSVSDAKQQVQDQGELAQARIQQAQEQAEQARDQALAKADAMREEALAKAETMRAEALAKAEAMREEALAQAAMARAEVVVRRAELQQLRVHAPSQVRLSHAANRRLLVMSGDPCESGQASDLVTKSIELSDEQ